MKKKPGQRSVHEYKDSELRKSVCPIQRLSTCAQYRGLMSMRAQKTTGHLAGGPRLCVLYLFSSFTHTRERAKITLDYIRRQMSARINARRR